MNKYNTKPYYLIRVMVSILLPFLLTSCNHTKTPYETARDQYEIYVPYDNTNIVCKESNDLLSVSYLGEQTIIDYRIEYNQQIEYLNGSDGDWRYKCTATICFIYGTPNDKTIENSIFQAGSPASLTIGSTDEIDWVYYKSYVVKAFNGNEQNPTVTSQLELIWSKD